MAAGITNHMWSIEEIVSLFLATRALEGVVVYTPKNGDESDSKCHTNPDMGV
jgi:hypothetical protein